MSNTNVPPSPNQALIGSLNQLNDTLRDAPQGMAADIRRSVENFQRSIKGFFNPVTRLQDSLQRVDKTNQAALRQGINTQKLTRAVDRNTGILSEGLTNNLKLTQAIIANTEYGVRTQSRAFLDLTREMQATGQDTTGLRKATADLLLFTGENTDAIDKSVRRNQEISDKYGISNERLIQSVNSLRDTFEEASFFGGDTTASLENLAKELKARTGGKDVEGAIRTLFQLGTGGASNVGAAILGGAGGFRGKIAAGQQVGLGDIEPILARVAEIAESSRGIGGGLGLGADVAAARLGLTKQQVNQLLQLNEQFKQNFELDQSVKAENDEKFKTVANLQDKAKNFYDNTAMSMLGTLNTINLSILGLGVGMAQAGGLGAAMQNFNLGPQAGAAGLGLLKSSRGRALAMRKMFGNKRRIGATLGRGAAGGLAGLAGGLGIDAFGQATGTDLGGMSTGFGIGATIGSIFPGVGTLLGGGIGALAGGALDLIAANTGKTAEELEAQRKIEEEERARRRAEEASRDMSRLDFISGYIRARGGSFLENPEMIKLMQEQIEETKKLRNKIASSSNTTSVNRKP